MIFFTYESELLKRPREEQEQLCLSQGLTGTNSASSSERVEISLVGDQLAMLVNVAVRVKRRGVHPSIWGPDGQIRDQQRRSYSWVPGNHTAWYR